MNEDLKLAQQLRDYSTLQLWTVDWDDFRDEAGLERINHVYGFEFYAQLSGLGRWASLVNPSRVALRLLPSIEEALTEAGFVNLPAIETILDTEGLGFRYKDAEFGFDLLFRGDGQILLSRGGSSLETFHKWYVGLMPSVPAILLKVMSALEEELWMTLHPNKEDANKERDNKSENVRILAAGFTFRVVCLNLEDETGKECKNLDVMRKNVAVRVPTADGRLSDEAAIDFDRYGRMDYKASLRHEQIPSIAQFLTVEAPSNANWKALFFEFLYAGENYFTKDGKRSAMDPDLFLSSARCADAYISFFRDIGLKGFLTSVLDSYSYTTTASHIS